MRCPYLPSLALALLFIITVASTLTVTAQNNFSIPAGSLIIAMDNERQGSGLPYGQTGGTAACSGPQFNIRAYGYAVRLLQQNVKLHWVIDADKASNASYDISNINVNQLPQNPYGGQNCATYGGGVVSFRGGPLVIKPEYAAAARSILETFNASTDNANDVRVYAVQADHSLTPNSDVTELTHRPFVAVGPNCPSGQQNCLPPDVYEELYTAAGLVEGTDFAPVSDEVFQTKCPTLAAQAHALTTAVSFRDDYQAFVASGGNMMLQCRSVEIFEDASLDLFFTTNGIAGEAPGSPETNSTTIVNPYLPFNQFVGDLARTNGYTRYVPNGGSWLGSTVFAAQKTNNGNNKVAFWRDTTATVGGVVMALGGHEYGGYSGDGVNAIGGSGSVATNANYERVNGSRMALNAILVPSRAACSFNPPNVQGYKTVRLGPDTGDDLVPVGTINVQDNVEWTVRYINTSTTPISNFQITDAIDSRLLFVPSSLTARVYTNSADLTGTPVTVNPSFTGVAPNTAMLASGFTLQPGRMVTVKFKTKVLLVAAEIPNQAVANGNGIQSPVSTDSADKDTDTVVLGYPIAGDCLTSPVCQEQDIWVPGSPIDNWTAAIEPTYIALSTITTAGGAEVTGKVVDARGRGIAREQVMIQNASTGELLSVMTNSFGNFRFVDVPVGEFYIISVQSRRNTYEIPSYGFSLEDNLAGIQFVASVPGVVRGIDSMPPVQKSVQVDDAVRVDQPVVKTAPAVSAPVQRRTVVVKPVKEKESKDDESKDN